MSTTASPQIDLADALEALQQVGAPQQPVAPTWLSKVKV
jgi:hypothetical protein